MNKKLKIGITGQNGFLGTHLFNHLSLDKERYELVKFERSFFNEKNKLEKFVSECDTLIHIAGLNRHESLEFIHAENIRLTDTLIAALKKTNSTPHLLFASSTQEGNGSLYGDSKKVCRIHFAEWSKQSGSPFLGMVLPNLYGPFGRPFYNSVVATFCHQLTTGLVPEVHNDADLSLLYVGDLVKQIEQNIIQKTNQHEMVFSAPLKISVKGLVKKLMTFKDTYIEKNSIPELNSINDLELFNTFRSYLPLKDHFPRKHHFAEDERGAFSELIRLGIGGQVSFSFTHPGIVRGNHFHTRKIERFSVIKGKALIQLRKFNSEEVFEFELDGEKPAFVDMPIWYTHNIKNIGKDTLYTVFWINEPYDPKDADTYFEKV